MKKLTFISFLLLLSLQLFSGTNEGRCNNSKCSITINEVSLKASQQALAGELEGNVFAFHSAPRQLNRLSSSGLHATAAFHVDALYKLTAGIGNAASYGHAGKYLLHIYPSHNFW